MIEGSLITFGVMLSYVEFSMDIALIQIDSASDMCVTTFFAGN